ncbi:MAG: hypothetical protein P4L69_13535 [Desulfosporosinus sp.]|nr:hypothetical protein [Desulfosporosinus sp.]
MNKDYTIIAVGWIITTVSLVKFIPKNKIREALVAFLVNQLITWVLGLTVVELGLIEYPVRLFPHANNTSFTFEYFIYPSMCAIFNVNYPKSKSRFGQFMYYFYYCTTFTIFEVIIEKNANLLKYIHWSWYITWITLLITFYMTRKFYVWFFRLNKDN